MTTFSVRLPDEDHQHARTLAERDGQSLNDFIVTAVEEAIFRRRLANHAAWVTRNPSAYSRYHQRRHAARANRPSTR